MTKLGFPPGARVLIEGRHEAIVRQYFHDGSHALRAAHYKVDFIDGDRNVCVHVNRVSVETAKLQSPINGGTGAEPWLLGWELRRRYRFSGGPPVTLALAGDVLRGYVACAIAISRNALVDDDAALAAWTRDNVDGGWA